MKLLAIHGIGHHDLPNRSVWQTAWTQAIKDGIGQSAPAEPVDVAFLEYDDLFETYLKNLGAAEFAKAAWNLGSGVVTAGARGLFDLSDSTRWHAGMVVVFVNHDDLRQKLRDRLLQALDQLKPDVIAGHSLGSLLAYDLFSQAPDARKGRTFVSFGSQVGNTFIRGQFAGRVEPFTNPPLDMPWFHLYNPNDHVFTAPLDFGDFQTAANFEQIETKFGDFWTADIAANHDAVSEDGHPDHAYLTHPQTKAVLWPQLAGHFVTRSLTAAVTVTERARPSKETPANPQKRALLVGINQYPPNMPALQGCVNDVFLVSSVLQECGFEADDIRVVLDDRATIAGIQERLHWLLDATRPEDVRFLYFSGHGAMLPIYGPEGQIDRTSPCLVPYDFVWTKETAITDEALLNFYSQLPYDSHFMMVLDCCHAGGLTRGTMQPRGLEPPDDIRHRLLQWDRKLQMWKPRELHPLNKDLSKSKERDMYVGPSGAEYRLGRAISLRTLPDKEFDKVARKKNHEGPYFPVVLEACEVNELAYEYEHGVTGHGAFTFAFAAALRRSTGEQSYAELIKETGKVLKTLGYDQHPQAAGPRTF